MDVDRKDVWKRYHRDQMRPSRIASELGLTRKQVEEIVKETAAKRRRRNIVLGATLVVALGAVIFSLWYSSQNSSGTNTPASIRQVADQYLAGRAPDRWLLTSEQAEGADFPFLINLTETMTARIRGILTKYEGILEVAQLKTAFSNAYVSFYAGQSGGTSRRIAQGNPDLSFLRNPSQIEVVLYGRGHESAARIQNHFAKYDPEWRALILRGIAFHKDWFDGIVGHELWHALLHRQDSVSALAPPLSDLWIGEELQAHELERKIIDRATTGQYVERLKQIVLNKKKKISLEALYDSISLEDLRSLDQIFGEPTQDEVHLRLAQYLFDMGDVWLGERYGGSELQRYRILHYRLIRKI